MEPVWPKEVSSPPESIKVVDEADVVGTAGRGKPCIEAQTTAVVSSGVALSEIAGPFSAADVAANCSGGAMKEPLLWVISYALIAVCAVVLIILLLLLVLPCRRRNFSGEITDESSLVRHRIK